MSFRTEQDIDGLQGHLESDILEIKCVRPDKKLKKTEDMVRTIQGMMNGAAPVAHIILGLGENERHEVDLSKKTPVQFPIEIDGMNYVPASFTDYRDHVLKMVRTTTHGYHEGLCKMTTVPASSGGVFIVIEVKQSEYRPHRNPSTSRCYIRRAEGVTDVMGPDEQELEIAEKRRRLGGLPATPISVERVSGGSEIEGFLHSGKPLAVLMPFGDREGSREIVLMPGSESYLILKPPKGKEREWSLSELFGLVRSPSPVTPFGRWTGSWTERNEYGVMVFQESSKDDGVALSLTQVCRNGELYGIDRVLLNAERLKEFAGSDFPYVPMGAIEDIFVRSLREYLAFFRSKLRYEPPFNFEAGVRGVKGYALAVPVQAFGSRFAGDLKVPNVEYKATIVDFDEDAGSLLKPFFEKLWSEAGVERP